MRFLILTLLFLARPLAAQDLLLATWNIQDLGGSKSDAEIAAMARILKDADIVAIQEVVAKDPAGAQAVARLAQALNLTGAKWDYRVSVPTTGSASQSERYAFLWKTSRATLLSGYGLVSELAGLVRREPYVARFRTGSRELVLVNFHAVPHKDNPEQEIKEVLRLAKSFGDLPVVFLADWNLVDHHTVFHPVKAMGYRFALSGVKTTLKQSCDGGNYLNYAIDNILLPASLKVVSAYAGDFVRECADLQAARAISDHLPVFVRIQ